MHIALDTTTVALIGAVSGFLGAISGNTLSAYLNYRLGDKTRKLEIFKVVFPEMFRAIQRLAQEAYTLDRATWHHENYEVHTDEAETNRDKIVEIADSFIHYAYSIEWLVGSTVYTAAQEFGISCKETVGWQDPEVYPIAECHYTTAYDNLTEAIKKVAFVKDVATIFRMEARITRKS